MDGQRQRFSEALAPASMVFVHHLNSEPYQMILQQPFFHEAASQSMGQRRLIMANPWLRLKLSHSTVKPIRLTPNIAVTIESFAIAPA
jgi:hypothetical protein